MVSFWPWKGRDASPASFEKALAALATKIASTQARLDRTRSTGRRVRVLSTLYMTFAYLVYAIVLVLVVGRQQMGAWEWSGVAGGPVLIYVVRTAVAAYYNYRIEVLAARLKDQQAERATTIQKLKDATKYDSTLQLLEKYGGAEAKPGKGKDRGGSGGGGGGPSQLDGSAQARTGGAGAGLPSTPPAGRTRLPPPPTANIVRRGATSSTPASQQGTPRAADGLPRGGGTGVDVTAEFAPNAFEPGTGAAAGGGPYAPAVAGSVSAGGGEPHWYDRILDLLLGDDETAARNRIVLICSTCRLVNGQAPPGTRSLAEMGSWRCMGCGARNGEAAEAQKIVSEVLGQARADRGDSSEGGGDSQGDEPAKDADADADADANADDSEGRSSAVEKASRATRKRGKKT